MTSLGSSCLAVLAFLARYCGLGHLLCMGLFQIVGMGAIFGFWPLKVASELAMVGLALAVPWYCHIACGALDSVKKEQQKHTVAFPGFCLDLQEESMR